MSYYIVPQRHGRMNRHQPVGFNGGCRLPVDVHANSDEYVITANVPGLKADDLQIEIIEDVVTLRGEVKEKENGQEDVLLRELHRGSYERSLRLPDMLEADKAEASIEDGVLMLRIPKSEESKPKKIEVKSR
ncbi:MAG: Hsp20/alpha crystallin family protein [Anaerolineales bacterium]|nr:Hsp20/alpha crystallin family protein [Anaerolineales bacterium]